MSIYNVKNKKRLIIIFLSFLTFSIYILIATTLNHLIDQILVSWFNLNFRTIKWKSYIFLPEKSLKEHRYNFYEQLIAHFTRMWLKVVAWTHKYEVILGIKLFELRCVKL